MRNKWLWLSATLWLLSGLWLVQGLDAQIVNPPTSSGGTISSITSTGGTVGVTNPAGPATNLDIPTSYLASPPAIGGTAPAAVTGTTLAAANTSGQVLALGSTATVGTATPASINSGGSYATGTLGTCANMKWRLFDNNSGGSTCYGFGISSGVLEYSVPATDAHNFYVNGVMEASISSVGIASGGKISVAAARKGTFVCTNGGTITIANANEAATSDVIISLNAQGGTITTPPAMKTVTGGTGFTVLCGATDTSTYNYDILN